MQIHKHTNIVATINLVNPRLERLIHHTGKGITAKRPQGLSFKQEIVVSNPAGACCKLFWTFVGANWNCTFLLLWLCFQGRRKFVD